MIGTYRVPSGARIEYNTESTPSYIVHYDTRGTCKRRIGDIRERDVRRAIENLRQRHPEQRRLF